MARPRQFDEDRAVEAAMRAFWDAGYEATSTADLCAATGLGRSSIYNTFASKHDLFERALRHYMTGKNAELADILDGEAPARQKVRTLLWQAIEDARGCLVVNTLVELAPRDPVVAGMLQRDHEVRLTALTAAIESGIRAGEIDRGKDPRALARFVIATIGGMRVAARSGAAREELEQIAETALGAI
ncbi:TetR/AcrR family transcriptional regulator [Nonomuraea sediminis]|uniref:TetR/AcrR family transcriptional regulator n=1 Tax=Nonomuraea sediminis TaxID=2835864 RepID=UPI001BDCD4F2|nr:TetR/AcrR family transcriptional regulator [Nonomuraea sediminis]